MKRITSIFLTLMLIISLLAACGGQSAPEADAGQGDQNTTGVVTIKFWNNFVEAQEASCNDIIKAFNESQDKIVVESTFFPYDEFEAKIQTSLMSGSAGADLYETWGGWARDFIAADSLSPVPDDLMGDLENDCYEPVLGGFKGDDGKYYGLPLEFNNEYGGLLVNKVRFEEAGIPYPTTWDEMIDVAKKVSSSDGDVMTMRGFEFCTTDNMPTLLASMILQKGGYYIKDGKIAFGNNPIATECMNTLVSYVVDDKLTNLDGLAGGEDSQGHMFLCEDVAMMVLRGSWVIRDCETSYGKIYGEDIEYIPLPWFGNEKAFIAETGWGFCVPKNSKVVNEAWKFVEYFMKPENIESFNARTGWLPPRKSVVEGSNFVEALPYTAPVLDVLQYGKFIGKFNSDVFKADIAECFVDLCRGVYGSTDEALIALDKKMNADLKLE